MVPRFTSFALLSFGIATAAIGFVYGVLFAGVPYPDPTPEQLRDYDATLRVSELMVLAGAGSGSRGSPGPSGSTNMSASSARSAVGDAEASFRLTTIKAGRL